ncbi:hypothetical protein GCM10027449_18720 [Sinomonas notoginsengisoli]
MFLEEPRGGGLPFVEDLDVTVALPVVVVRVDHDLARERPHRDPWEALEGDRDDGEIASRCGVRGCRSSSPGTELSHEVR